jgi:CRP-like cAMP-binding protein
MALNNPHEEEVFDLLIDSSMFNRLPGDSLRIAAKYFGINNYSAGDTIFEEGDKGTFMCFVQKGRVSVVKKDVNGEVVVMGTEGPGQNFGEMAVLDGEPRSATCVAETKCEILSLAKTELEKMLKERPQVGIDILRIIAISLSRRMRFAAGRLVDHLEQS